MSRDQRLSRLVQSVSVVLVIALLGYKLYLNFIERDFQAVHAHQVARIESALEGRDAFRFAVVGNVNNSIGIFERKIIPQLNASGVDFVVSAGNSVSGNGEDKYRALYRSLGNLRVPYLLVFGENEYSRLGSYRYYDHFGPYLFAFDAGNSQFLFLDSAGVTHPSWQLRWLEQQLEATPRPEHTFVFSGHPLKPVDLTGLLEFDHDYLMAPVMREAAAGLMERHQVTAVFSSNLPIYAQQRHHDTDYVLTGGAGGLVLNNERSYYHYVIVEVRGETVNITPVELMIGQHPFWRTVESLWFFIHSFFYVGYLNFILVLAGLLALGLWLRRLLFTERDYYPDFDLDTSGWTPRSFRVAHFTNNYLPFIGGVPISIDRLRQGLSALGDEVLVVAPSYQDQAEDEPGVLRVSSLRPMGENREFRLANIFSLRLWREVFRYRPDVIHVHHPFWLGHVGRFIARRLQIPVVFTYHTRLEHYAHHVRLPGPLFRNLISHALVRHFANRCDAVIVPTASTEEYLRLIGVKRPLTVQPTGIEVSRFGSKDEDTLRLLRQSLGLENRRILVSVSRLSKEKNIEFMLDALAPALRRHRDWCLMLVGDGPSRDTLRARAEQLDISEQLVMPGSVAPADLPHYYHLADLFVFASRSETQGMVILEAMAAGLPVVVVRSSGIDDAVRDGDNGYKTPLNRDRFRQRVVELMRNDDRRQQMARNAVHFAEQHDIAEFGRAVHQVYAEAWATRAEAGLPIPARLC